MHIVAVGYIGGRVGSSMTMGLLEKSGFDVGTIDRNKSPKNEKGFFEITEYLHYLRSTFFEFNQFMPPMPNLKTFIMRLEQRKMEFLSKFDNWFTGDKIAIKVPYYLPVFYFLEHFDVTLIGLTRDTKSQAASIRKMNTQDGNFKQWLTDWQKYIDDILTPDTTIDMQDWLNDPYKTYLELANTVQAPKILSKHEVNGWFDPNMIHHA